VKEKLKTKSVEDEDENLDKWDIVICADCGKELSLLNGEATPINNGENFICKKGCR